MKTYCSFTGFQEELSLSLSGIEEDWGGVVTPRALVRLKRIIFGMHSLTIKVSNIYIFHLKHAFIKGIWTVAKQFFMSILQRHYAPQINVWKIRHFFQWRF